MYASSCLICGLPLKDAKSQEVGIGPVCRRNTHYAEEAKGLSDSLRQQGNVLIHQLSSQLSDVPALKTTLSELAGLGFFKTADALRRAIASVHIHQNGETYYVKAPYNPDAIRSWHTVPSQWWDGKRKVRLFDVQDKALVWDLLQRHYSGRIGCGPRGLFQC